MVWGQRKLRSRIQYDPRSAVSVACKNAIWSWTFLWMSSVCIARDEQFQALNILGVWVRAEKKEMELPKLGGNWLAIWGLHFCSGAKQGLQLKIFLYPTNRMKAMMWAEVAHVCAEKEVRSVSDEIQEDYTSLDGRNVLMISWYHCENVFGSISVKACW